MYSIVFGLALATATNSPAANLPAWQLDYRQAKAQAAKEQKPLAVVIGRGSAGWDGVLAGTLSDAAAQTLRNSYICVYVDAATESGKKLASEFSAASAPTLVISDKTGEIQAYRHSGAVEAARFETVLTRYADPNMVVTTTEQGNAPQAKPAAPAAPAPVYVQPTYYPATSSCPNCRR